MSTGSEVLRRRSPTPQMTDEELQMEIVRLQQENSSLDAKLVEQSNDYRKLRAEAVRQQQCAEVEEESIANNLFRRLDNATRETKKLGDALHREELQRQELQRELDAITHRQEEMENQLEQEQEYLLNGLQRQLIELSSKKKEAEKQLATERACYLEILASQIRRVQHSHPQKAYDRERSPSVTPSDTPVRTRVRSNSIVELEEQVNAMLLSHAKAQHEQQRCDELTDRLEKLQQATVLDRNRAVKLKEDLERAKVELNALEQLSRPRSLLSPTSSSDTGASSHDNTPVHQRRNLIDRTKEVLSTPRWMHKKPAASSQREEVPTPNAADFRCRSVSPMISLVQHGSSIRSSSTGYGSDAELTRLRHSIGSEVPRSAPVAVKPSRSSDAPPYPE
jgi:chromosome segregation ATPase